jgi:hypothetical protein
MRRATSFIALTAAALMAAPALAKLPAPSDEVKAKAAAAAAKTAWSDKVGSYQLCQAMDRVAESYRKSAKAVGKDAPAAVDTPACADPGPFVAAVPAAPPLEAAGAHSPPQTAVAPPSGKATAAELQGQPKK